MRLDNDTAKSQFLSSIESKLYTDQLKFSHLEEIVSYDLKDVISITKFIENSLQAINLKPQEHFVPESDYCNELSLFAEYPPNEVSETQIKDVALSSFGLLAVTSFFNNPRYRKNRDLINAINIQARQDIYARCFSHSELARVKFMREIDLNRSYVVELFNQLPNKVYLGERINNNEAVLQANIYKGLTKSKNIKLVKRKLHIANKNNPTVIHYFNHNFLEKINEVYHELADLLSGNPYLMQAQVLSYATASAQKKHQELQQAGCLRYTPVDDYADLEIKYNNLTYKIHKLCR